MTKRKHRSRQLVSMEGTMNWIRWRYNVAVISSVSTSYHKFTSKLKVRAGYEISTSTRLFEMRRADDNLKGITSTGYAKIVVYPFMSKINTRGDAEGYPQAIQWPEVHPSFSSGGQTVYYYGFIRWGIRLGKKGLSRQGIDRAVKRITYNNNKGTNQIVVQGRFALTLGQRFPRVDQHM